MPTLTISALEPFQFAFDANYGHASGFVRYDDPHYLSHWVHLSGDYKLTTTGVECSWEMTGGNTCSG